MNYIRHPDYFPETFPKIVGLRDDDIWANIPPSDCRGTGVLVSEVTPQSKCLSDCIVY